MKIRKIFCDVLIIIVKLIMYKNIKASVQLALKIVLSLIALTTPEEHVFLVAERIL